jgi:hypothetical protein
MADQPPGTHPAIHHYQQAAEHLRRATDLLEKVQKRGRRNEHASAAELAKGAMGHIGESTTHLAEARRIHAAHEAGSHWNDAPEPEQP